VQIRCTIIISSFLSTPCGTTHADVFIRSPLAEHGASIVLAKCTHGIRLDKIMLLDLISGDNLMVRFRMGVFSVHNFW
jgi:hypothetical protein